jgi:hypothetical protein
MELSMKLASCLLVAALASGCTKVSTKYCAMNPDDERCGIDGVGPPCTANGDCARTPGTPVCDRLEEV